MPPVPKVNDGDIPENLIPPRYRSDGETHPAKPGWV